MEISPQDHVVLINLLVAGFSAFGAVASGAAAWVAASLSDWYATEARSAGKLNRAELIASVLPYVTTRISRHDPNSIRKESLALPSDRLQDAPANSTVIFTLRTADERLPNHIFCVWYKASDGRCVVSCFLLEALEHGSDASLPITQDSFSIDETLSLLRDIYENLIESNSRLQDWILNVSTHARNGDMLLTFFIDQIGTLYAVPSPVRTQASGEYVFFKSDIIVPPGYETVADPFNSTGLGASGRPEHTDPDQRMRIARRHIRYSVRFLGALSLLMLMAAAWIYRSMTKDTHPDQAAKTVASYTLRVVGPTGVDVKAKHGKHKIVVHEISLSAVVENDAPYAVNVERNAIVLWQGSNRSNLEIAPFYLDSPLWIPSERQELIHLRLHGLCKLPRLDSCLGSKLQGKTELLLVGKGHPTITIRLPGR